MTGTIVAVELYLPKMSDHMDEAVFLQWLVEEGDSVEEGQPLLAVETDKVDAEVEAPTGGFIKGMRPGLTEGMAVRVGETIAYIVDDLEEEVPSLGPLEPGSETSSRVESADIERTADAESSQLGPTSTPHASPGAVAATPAGRRVARELGIDLADVVGTGPGGRISEIDVRRHASSHE